MPESCAHCGQPIVEGLIGSTTAWFHDRGAGREIRYQRACGWAEPTRPGDQP